MCSGPFRYYNLINRQAGCPLNLPSQSDPAFLLPLAAVLERPDRPDADFHPGVNFSPTEQCGVLAKERAEATGRK
jgi:hypothetical protein